MAVKGWMRGVSNIRFLPESPLTRAEAAVILVRAFELAGKVEETAFKDIRGHWAEREINLAAREKIVLGRGKGLFGPDDPVTRQELAVWKCTECGETKEGRCRPQKCPKCGASKDKFEKSEPK
jgi:rubrerythrin